MNLFGEGLQSEEVALILFLVLRLAESQGDLGGSKSIVNPDLQFVRDISGHEEGVVVVLPISRHRRQLVVEREIGNDTSQVGGAFVCGVRETAVVPGRQSNSIFKMFVMSSAVREESPWNNRAVNLSLPSLGCLLKKRRPVPRKSWVFGKLHAPFLPGWNLKHCVGWVRAKRLHIMFSSSTQKTLLCF